jgi:DNA-binding IclR family transcriptional regulator/tetratricopeptide (TPR) repeat protein
MESCLHGEVGEKPMAALIGEIAERRLSGLLCLQRDESAKTIHFEAGTPVFAASDVTSEQLEYRLVQGGLVEEELIEEARGSSLTTEELGWNLVKIGALSQEVMDESIRELAADIILSVFEWNEGDYIFYEDSDPCLTTKLDWTPDECLLAAARRATKSESLPTTTSKSQGKLVQTGLKRDSLPDAVTLNSIEAFVLSSIVLPTEASDVASLTGLPQAEAQNVVDALLRLGLLKIDGEENVTEDAVKPDAVPENRAAAEQAVNDANANRTDCDSLAEDSAELATVNTCPPSPNSTTECAGSDAVVDAAPPARPAGITIAQDARLVQTCTSTDSFPRDVALSSLEGFVLSSIAGPTRACDVVNLTGLSEEESRKAIGALLDLGLLRVEGEEQPADDRTLPDNTESLDHDASASTYALDGEVSAKPAEGSEVTASPCPAASTGSDDSLPDATQPDLITTMTLPPDARLVQTYNCSDSFLGGAALSSLEGFVLSLITAPTLVSDVATLTGLPEAEARSAIDDLLRLGLLRIDGCKEGVTDTSAETRDAADQTATHALTEATQCDDTSTVPPREAADVMIAEPASPALPVSCDHANEANQPAVLTTTTLTPDARLVQTYTSADSFPAGVAVSSLEGFVLSLIGAPTPAGDIATLTGLPEDAAQEAIHALLKLGLLRLEGDNGGAVHGDAKQREATTDTAEQNDGVTAGSTTHSAEGTSLAGSTARTEEPDGVTATSSSDSSVSGDSRHTLDAAAPNAITTAILPDDATLVATYSSSDSFPAGVALSSLEGFVLSSIAAPTPLRDVAVLTGLPEAEAKNAIEVLLKFGLLRLAGEDGPIDASSDTVQRNANPTSCPTGDTHPHVAEDGTSAKSDRPAESSGEETPSSPAFPECNLSEAGQPDEITSTLLPPDATLVQANASTSSFPGGVGLSSLEGFVLSSIAGPTQVRDLAAVTGLPEAKAQNAIGVLLKFGLLRLDGGATNGNAAEKPDQSNVAAEQTCGSNGDRSAGASVEWAMELVAGKLKSTDHYGVIGVERIAPSARIAAAYQELKEKVESFLTRWPDHSELSHNAGSLIARMEEAYETLSDPEKRRAYDRPPSAAGARRTAKRGKGLKSTIVPAGPEAEAGTFAPAPFSVAFDPDVQPASLVASVKNAPTYDPIVAAADHFNKGKARFDRNDFHTGVHHFREAARLDPSKPDHHYYLAVTLSILAQARHERHSHTHDIGSHVTCTLGGGLARNPRLRREAEQHLLKALELDRKNPEITIRLARLYQDAGIQKKSSHYFLETLLLDPSNPTALRELGLTEQARERSLVGEKPSAKKRSNSARPTSNKPASDVFVISEADI